MENTLTMNSKIKDGNMGQVKIDNFVKIHPHGSKPPFILVHGQQANFYIKGLIEYDQPFYGYLHPGSDGEEIKFDSVPQMAEAYLDQLLHHSPKGPYLLGGFSFGGILAFEMAVQLKKLGHEVPVLALIDTSSPLDCVPVIRHSNLLRMIKSDILVPPVMKVLKISRLSLCETYIRLKKPIPLVLRQYYIINKYRILMKSYHPEKFEGEILLFRATENLSSSKFLGWETLAKSIKVVELEGDHLTTVGEKSRSVTIYSEIKKYYRVS